MMDDAALLHELEGYLAAAAQPALSDLQRNRLLRAMPALKERAKDLPGTA